MPAIELGIERRSLYRSFSILDGGSLARWVIKAGAQHPLRSNRSSLGDFHNEGLRHELTKDSTTHSGRACSGPRYLALTFVYGGSHAAEPGGAAKPAAVEAFFSGLSADQRAQAEETWRKASPAQRAEMEKAVTAMQREQAEHPTLKIGDTLPEFALKGVDGKIRTPADYKSSAALVVMFISNHYPTSQLYETRMKKLYQDYAGKGVAFVAIQPDSPSRQQRAVCRLRGLLEAEGVRVDSIRFN